MPIANRAEIQSYLRRGSAITDADLGLAMLLRPGVESAIARFLGYDVVYAERTEFLPDDSGPQLFGDEAWDVRNGVAFRESAGGRSILSLHNVPVRSVESVHQDYSGYAGQGVDAFPPSAELQQGTHYFLDMQSSGLSWTGKLIRIAGSWPSSARSVRIVYCSGLTEEELAGEYADVKMAALISIAKAFNEVKANQNSSTGASGAIVAERLADYSVQYQGAVQAELHGFAKQLPGSAMKLLEPFRRLAA